MSDLVACARCGEQGAPITSEPPLPAELAEEVRDRVCERCWKEWEPQEVMVINELRLNFMDPASRDILYQRMREFLGLTPPGEGATAPEAD